MSVVKLRNFRGARNQGPSICIIISNNFSCGFWIFDDYRLLFVVAKSLLDGYYFYKKKNHKIQSVQAFK